MATQPPFVALNGGQDDLRVVDYPTPIILGPTLFSNTDAFSFNPYSRDFTTDPVPADYWYLIDRITLQLVPGVAQQGPTFAADSVRAAFYLDRVTPDRLLDYTPAAELAEAIYPVPLRIPPNRAIILRLTCPGPLVATMTCQIDYRLAQR